MRNRIGSFPSISSVVSRSISSSSSSSSSTSSYGVTHTTNSCNNNSNSSGGNSSSSDNIVNPVIPTTSWQVGKACCCFVFLKTKNVTQPETIVEFSNFKCSINVSFLTKLFIL